MSVADVDGSLQERFDPRHNHLNRMRLGLALGVAFTHALEIGFGYQPHIGTTGYGELAVDAFFVLSGFLLAGSFVRLESVPRYVWHRFLRIMPGFWTCLLITALVVAPLVALRQGRSAGSVFSGDESAVDYLVRNCLLLIQQYGIAGLPTGVPQAGVLNGSLWTLFYEALCYAAVVLLGLVGALRRRPMIMLAVVGALWAATALNAAGVQVVGAERPLRFALMFLIGSALFVHARRVPVRGSLALVALALLVAALLWLPDYRAPAAPAFGYLCLVVAVTRPPASTSRTDVSYGLYVYHWPILQLLVAFEGHRLGQPVFVVLGLGLAFLAAQASWRLVESPALRFKDAALPLVAGTGRHRLSR